MTKVNKNITFLLQLFYRKVKQKNVLLFLYFWFNYNLYVILIKKLITQ